VHVCLSFTISSFIIPAILTWVLIELARDALLQQRIRSELLAVFPGTSDADYDTLSDPAQLPLLDGTIHEVLRLYPPVLEAWRTVSVPCPRIRTMLTEYDPAPTR
jgi:cytochrome P450